MSESVYDFTAAALLLFFRLFLVAWAVAVLVAIRALIGPFVAEAVRDWLLHRRMDRWAREQERQV